MAVPPKTATVPVASFLSLFQGKPLEVNASQSFHDGNIDVAWKKGCVLTAKTEELWDARGNVTAEDIRHMQNRCDIYTATAPIIRLETVPECEVCMARWIRDKAAEFDEAARIANTSGPSLISQALGGSGGMPTEIDGLGALCTDVRIPVATAESLTQELVSLGAVCVQELALSDWQTLASWALVKPLERRRLLAALGIA